MNAFHRVLTRIHKLEDVVRALARRDTWRSVAECQVLLACHDNDRGGVCDGQAFSPLLDSVGEDLASAGLACSRFALPYSHLAGERAYGRPVAANRALLAANLARLLKRVLHRSSGSGSSRSNPIVMAYRTLLRASRCRAVIAIGAPADLCRAGQAEGIPVIELLHGMGYGFVPWGWEEADRQDVPDGILSLDAVSTTTFSVLRKKGIWIAQIPHPWLKRFRSADPAHRRPCPLRGVEITPPRFERTVLVSLQWGYDGEVPEFDGIIENGVMPAALERAIDNTQASVYWLLRLHPVQLRRYRYRRHVNFVRDLSKRMDNCEWHDASTIPLPVLLSQCDGHVTMNSMTTYEAAYLGVPTLLLCPSLAPGGIYESYFSDVRASGHARMSEPDDAAIAKWAESVTRLPAFQVKDLQSWEAALQRIVGPIGAAAKQPG